MKKKLEDELMSLAHSILQLRGRGNLEELKNHARELYEKLSVLSFAERHFNGPQPTIGKTEVLQALTDEKQDLKEDDKKPEVTVEDNTNTPDPAPSIAQKITEPAPIENIKVLEEAQTEEPTQEELTENDFENFSLHADDLPEFEPAFSKIIETDQPEEVDYQADYEEESTSQTPDLFSEVVKPKTRNEVTKHKPNLNDKLHFGLKIGLNDRLAFTKHLFSGDVNDFNRMISQLNTLESFDEAKSFIEEQVKPDYDWSGQEEYEKRLIAVLEQKMD